MAFCSEEKPANDSEHQMTERGHSCPPGRVLEATRKADGNVGAPGSHVFAAEIPRFFPTIFFGICFLASWFWRAVAGTSPLLDAVVVSAAAIATLLALNQRLPLQNIVGLVVTIFIFWCATLLIEMASGVFLSPPRFRFEFVRPFEFGIFWVVGIVNARGIAKLFLHRWRNNANIGLWLIALSSLLIASEDFVARQDWIYFVEKFFFAAVIFASATPWWLDKRRTEQKPDFQPLLITLLLFLW